MAVSPQLVTPVCSVSPAGGGTITFAPIQTGKVPGLPQGIATDGEYKSFRYTATPAPGYQFVRFETHVTWTTENTSIVHDGYFSGTASSGGDWTYDAEPGNTWNDYFGSFLTAGYASWLRNEGFGTVEYDTATAISVVAVFAPVHVPTHLLVNSSSLGNPVQLVHDATTGLLVADF